VNGAVLTELGRRKAAELSRRAVVLVAIASLHALVVYLLASGSPGGYGRLETSVIEAEVIPIDRRAPNPPSFPPVIMLASSRIASPPPQIAIDLPQERPPGTQAIDTRDSQDSELPVVANALPEVDPNPIIRPRPIGGPRGVDRYPTASLKAKESGTVEMNICVSPAGRVDSVELARSSGFPRLDQVAVAMASEYQFQPATRYGHPVAACAHYRIVFKVV
jgi:periplasmic protein TonB